MFLNNYFTQQERREKKTGVLISYNSTYNKLDTEKKIQVYDRALNLARNAKSAHENNTKDIENKTGWINKHKIEWHKKFTLSVACLILFFIGAPLGAIIRKGGFGVPVIVSIFFFLVYYILSMIGEKYVKAGGLIAYQGMWMASSILLPIGVYLTYKATHDSNLFNLNIYINPIKNIFKKFTKKNKL
ncbi:MAG: LptF/LptG family permease [Bacteroidales bacterium]|nr:LptF/LptG family permease [Bacteroidales bacterium]